MLSLKDVRDRLKAEKNLTKLAADCGITRKTLYNIMDSKEKGGTHDVRTLEKLSDYYECADKGYKFL